MVINTNIAAESSASLLASSSANLAKSLQRLSSGSKLTTPQDDAAGLGVSMKFDAQSSRTTAAANNVSNATSYTQTQDGFLQQVGKALNRMSELAISAQDVTKTDTDRSLYNAEYGQLATYIGDTAKKDFNGVSLFDNTAKAVTVDSDGNTWSMGAINLGDTAYGTVGTQAAAAGIGTTTGAIEALKDVKAAITRLASDRALIGASLARLSYTNDQLSVQKTNIDLRVAVLPLPQSREDANQAAGASLLQSVLLTELAKRHLFEIIPVSPEILRGLTAGNGWAVDAQLPPEFFERLRQLTDCDAVVFASLTVFRPYPPLQTGWKIRLVDCREHQTWWAVDEVFDAGSESVVAAAEHYARVGLSLPNPLLADTGVLHSPLRFGQYAANAVVQTLPGR